MVVAENVAVGTVIQRVVTTDLDEPGTRNSRIQYSLESSEPDLFSIHRRSGQLSGWIVIYQFSVTDIASVAVADVTVVLICSE